MSERFQLQDESNLQDEPDLTDERALWKLYVSYVRVHMERVNKDDKIMTPGVFCQYFASKLSQRLKNGQPKVIITFREIIDELADDCTYDETPCLSASCMKIYDNRDGNTVYRNDICNWQH